MNRDPNKLPIRVDFDAYRGDDWTRLFDVTYSDESTNTAQSIDMTGWTGRMQIRESDADDAHVLLEVNSADSQITCGPQLINGRIWQMVVYLTAAQTRTLPAGLVAYYDIQLTKADGKVQTFYFGDFCVQGDITK